MSAGFAFAAPFRERLLTNLAAFRPRMLPAEGLRHAAVGVLLLPDASGRACFVLTRRLDTLRRHAGQWALPGGRLEADETVEQAALREIREEVSVSLPEDAVLGRLDDYITRSGHLVSLLVVWAAGET